MFQKVAKRCKRVSKSRKKIEGFDRVTKKLKCKRSSDQKSVLGWVDGWMDEPL
jgi:hypothetical protein